MIPLLLAVGVLIAGDSISQHYAPHVSASLAGVAEVQTLRVNGGRAATLPAKIDTAGGGPWSVIVVNAGLHDLRLDAGGPTPLDAYRRDLETLRDHLLTTYPGATVVWVRTTPVCDGDTRRGRGAEREYNTVADGVWDGYPTVDLHSLTVPHCNEWRKAPGNVHYNITGRRAQAASIAAEVERVLP